MADQELREAVTLVLGGCPYCGGEFDLYREDACILRCSSCGRYADAIGIPLSAYLRAQQD